MDNNGANVSKQLLTADSSYLLNYVICVYTATKQLHSFPVSFPITSDKAKYRCLQHISLGLTLGYSGSSRYSSS